MLPHRHYYVHVHSKQTPSISTHFNFCFWKFLVQMTEHFFSMVIFMFFYFSFYLFTFFCFFLEIVEVFIVFWLLCNFFPRFCFAATYFSLYFWVLFLVFEKNFFLFYISCILFSVGRKLFLIQVVYEIYRFKKEQENHLVR